MLQGTTIEKPRDVYEEWLETRVQPNELAVSFQRPMEFLEETSLNYALTTYRAENLVQGFLFPSTIDFYIRPEHRQGWLDLVEARGLLGGDNTRIRITDEHVYYNNRSLHGNRRYQRRN